MLTKIHVNKIDSKWWFLSQYYSKNSVKILVIHTQGVINFRTSVVDDFDQQLKIIEEISKTSKTTKVHYRTDNLQQV